MTTFVDTSAFYALISEDDPEHDAAWRWLDATAAEGTEGLVSHSYVVVESTALIAARKGNAAVRAFLEDVLPACEIVFVDQTLHERAVSAYLASLGRRASFVDRVSFELMRREGVQRAFTFDRDFGREGFETVP